MRRLIRDTATEYNKKDNNHLPKSSSHPNSNIIKLLLFRTKKTNTHLDAAGDVLRRQQKKKRMW